MKKIKIVVLMFSIFTAFACQESKLEFFSCDINTLKAFKNSDVSFSIELPKGYKEYLSEQNNNEDITTTIEKGDGYVLEIKLSDDISLTERRYIERIRFIGLDLEKATTGRNWKIFRQGENYFFYANKLIDSKRIIFKFKSEYIPSSFQKCKDVLKTLGFDVIKKYVQPEDDKRRLEDMEFEKVNFQNISPISKANINYEVLLPQDMECLNNTPYENIYEKAMYVELRRGYKLNIRIASTRIDERKKLDEIFSFREDSPFIVKKSSNYLIKKHGSEYDFYAFTIIDGFLIEFEGTKIEGKENAIKMISYLGFK